MGRIVGGDLLSLLANVKARRTMRAPEPYTANLIRVDVAECLAVQHVLEISGWVVGIRGCTRRYSAHPILVQQWQ